MMVEIGQDDLAKYGQETALEREIRLSNHESDPVRSFPGPDDKPEKPLKQFPDFDPVRGPPGPPHVPHPDE